MTLPARLWGIYAHRVYLREQRLGRKIHDRRAFEDAVALDGMRRYDQVAERWWRMFVIPVERLAECLVDQAPPRYAERRHD